MPTHSTGRTGRLDICRNGKRLELLMPGYLYMIITLVHAHLQGNGSNHTTAVPIATRSAQVPTGYAAFSTLAPTTNSPDVVRIHAPTRNLE